MPEPVVEPRRRQRSRARSGAGRLGRPRAARGARDAGARRAASPSCCTTCSPCRSTRSRRSSAARRPRRGSSRAAPAAGCRARPRFPTPIATRQREVVDAFLAASRGGDFEALLAVLDPDVVLRADPVAVRRARRARDRGAPALAPEVHGAAAVAETFSGRARAARPALINGIAGLVWAPGGQPRAVFALHDRRAARSSNSS